jgi:hypothetical protein
MSTLPPGEGPPVIPPNPCNSPACTGPKAELDAARAAFNSACRQLGFVTSILRFLRPFISVSLWVLIVLLIIAVVLWLLGIWLAIFIWLLLLIYAIAWILTIVFSRVAASLTQELAKHGQAVADAIAKVVAACPESCRGDLSVPVCNAAAP